MGRVNYGGLVIAGIGFFATRFTVTLALYEDPLRFYLAGVVPLLLGLGLAAFGVALAVADVEASLVRTTAAWCVAGTGAMLVLVVLTLLGSAAGDLSDPATVRSRAYLSNFLIGGSVGGSLTGLYASRNRRHREEVRRQANRLEVLNRLLRHEVLNALTVIRASASVDDAGPERIADQSDAIEGTIDEVTYLARSTRGDDIADAAVDLGECIEASVAAVTEEHPDADVSVGPVPDARVRATERLEAVFVHLLENAIVHAGDGDPAIEASATPRSVRVSVHDDGPGLPENQRALLEAGEIQPFDDPGAGFGLNIVRLLVDDFGGTIEVDAGDGGTTITVVLGRADAPGEARRPLPAGVSGVRPAVPHLLVTLVAAVIAGVPYGIVSELLGGSVAGIGVFYGAPSPVVGWLTHEFHSVVFGFVFAGLVSLAPARYRSDPLAHVAIGIGWALTLWVVAAGIIAPIWLRLLGIPAPVPSFSLRLLASHLAWGISLGALTAWGYTHVAPRLARRLD